MYDSSDRESSFAHFMFVVIKFCIRIAFSCVTAAPSNVKENSSTV